MASITFGLDLDPNNAFLNMPGNVDSVGITTGTVFEIGDPRFSLLRLEGTGFTYSSQGIPSGGTLMGFSLLQGGKTAVVVTGLSPLLTLKEAETIRGAGVANALLQYLLASNDIAIGGDGEQVIFSEGGNDTLDGREGADYLVAGDGDDFVISRLGEGPAAGKTEILIGGAGTDRLEIDRSDQALALVFDLFANGVTSMLDGTQLGSFEQMVFLSGSGNDDLAGGASDDLITTGAGNDRLTGRGGNDSLRGGAGADIMDGGSGDDLLTGDDGSDIIDGAEGNDLLEGGDGADNASGGVGNDTIMGSDGADLLEGGGGNDYIDGGAQSDNLFGGAEDDILLGGLGADYIEGGGGDDLLDGGDGPDILLGGPGNDIFSVENGNDLLVEINGEGRDTVVSSVSYTLAASAAVDVLKTIRPSAKSPLNLTGNVFKNVIDGNAGANTLNGRSGSDTLKGGRGEDRFVFDSKLGKKNIDKIVDFRVKDDSILLRRSIFEEISGRKELDVTDFQIGSRALEADDRIIYNPRNGLLSYDEDGTGFHKAIVFARLPKKLKLTFEDFLI
jgi:Ca2+-binding RTX toxin-like protein